MNSEPKDNANPFHNVIETIIEDDPSRRYKKVLKQYFLCPQWPDYQEETFAGHTMDQRIFALKQGKITEVELKRTNSNTEVFLFQGTEKNINMSFKLVLPDEERRMVLFAGFDNTGRLYSTSFNALPRHPFYAQKQPQDKNSDEIENPSMKIGEKTINIKDIAKSLGEENLNNIRWDNNPNVVEFDYFGHTKFEYRVLHSELEQESPSMFYNKDFTLMERQFRLENKAGLFIFNQKLLTPPFSACTITLPSIVPIEKVTDKLKTIGTEWRNFFDEYQIDIKISQVQ